MIDTYREALEEIINSLLTNLIQEYELSIEKEGDQWRVNLITTNPSFIIGAGGENIKALQHIIRVIIHKNFPDDRSHFIIDVSHFRLKREQIIKDRVIRLAQHFVITLGETIILIGLNGYERKIVHDMLADVENIDTTSVGDEFNRKLILRPTSEFGNVGIDNAKVVDIFKDKDLAYPTEENEKEDDNDEKETVTEAAL